MALETTRDIVIVILGILHIILTIGLIVGLLIAYLKVRKVIRNVSELMLNIRQLMAYVKGAFKGLSQSAKMFKKEG